MPHSAPALLPNGRLPLWPTLVALGQQAGALLRHRWWLALAVVFWVAAQTWLLMPHDDAVLAALRQQTPEAQAVAKFFDYAGEFQFGTLIPVVVLFAWGWAKQRARWQIAAVAVLLGATTASLAVNLLRPTFGRPRPSAQEKEQIADGFYGWSTRYAYNSFPSAHATNNMAMAVAVAVVAPPLAVPALGFATAVGWARLEANAHHLSDVLVGFCLGGLFGLWWGLAARRLWPSPLAPPSNGQSKA